MSPANFLTNITYGMKVAAFCFSGVKILCCACSNI